MDNNTKKLNTIQIRARQRDWPSVVLKEITNDSCLAKPPGNLPYRDIGGRGRGRGEGRGGGGGIN